MKYDKNNQNSLKHCNNNSKLNIFKAITYILDIGKHVLYISGRVLEWLFACCDWLVNGVSTVYHKGSMVNPINA